MKKSIYKTLLAIPITALHYITYLFDMGNKSKVPIAEMFLQFIFSGNPDRQNDNFFMTVAGLLEIIIFNLLFGTYMYHDLDTGSIYVIIRQKSRLKWYLIKSFQVFFFCTLYIIFYLGSVFLLCVFNSAFSIDKTAIGILFISVVIISLFTFISTLLINLCALRLGSNFGFIIIYAAISALTGLAIFYEKIPVLNKLHFALKFNPMANVVINWGISGQDTIFSVSYLLILTIFVLINGYCIIEKLDIGIRDPENNQ